MESLSPEKKSLLPAVWGRRYDRDGDQNKSSVELTQGGLARKRWLKEKRKGRLSATCWPGSKYIQLLP